MKEEEDAVRMEVTETVRENVTMNEKCIVKGV